MKIDECIENNVKSISKLDESYRKYFDSFVSQLETYADNFSFMDGPKIINSYKASLTILGKELTIRLEAVRVKGAAIMGKIKGIDNQTQAVMAEFCIDGNGQISDCKNGYEPIEPKLSLRNGDEDISCVALNFIWNCIEDGNCKINVPK